MKRKLFVWMLTLLLVLTAAVPAFAANDDLLHVNDAADILSYDEWEALEDAAAALSYQMGCGVYIVTVEDYRDYGSGDVYTVTTEIYHENGYGEGAGRDGIMILLSMRARDYAMFVYGDYAEYAFNSYGQEKLEDSFMDHFGSNDWYGGFSGYINACQSYLVQAAKGEPVSKNPAGAIAIVILVSLAAAAVVCFVLLRKMKSVHIQTEAGNYITAAGLNLTGKSDVFLYRTETRRRIEKDTESHSGGGGSGRSGKF